MILGFTLFLFLAFFVLRVSQGWFVERPLWSKVYKDLFFSKRGSSLVTRQISFLDSSTTRVATRNIPFESDCAYPSRL